MKDTRDERRGEDEKTAATAARFGGAVGSGEPGVQAGSGVVSDVEMAAQEEALLKGSGKVSAVCERCEKEPLPGMRLCEDCFVKRPEPADGECSACGIVHRESPCPDSGSVEKYEKCVEAASQPVSADEAGGALVGQLFIMDDCRRVDVIIAGRVVGVLKRGGDGIIKYEAVSEVSEHAKQFLAVASGIPPSESPNLKNRWWVEHDPIVTSDPYFKDRTCDHEFAGRCGKPACCMTREADKSNKFFCLAHAEVQQFRAPTILERTFYEYVPHHKSKPAQVCQWSGGCHSEPTHRSSKSGLVYCKSHTDLFLSLPSTAAKGIKMLPLDPPKDNPASGCQWSGGGCGAMPTKVLPETGKVYCTDHAKLIAAAYDSTLLPLEEYNHASGCQWSGGCGAMPTKFSTETGKVYCTKHAELIIPLHKDELQALAGPMEAPPAGLKPLGSDPTSPPRKCERYRCENIATHLNTNSGKFVCAVHSRMIDVKLADGLKPETSDPTSPPMPLPPGPMAVASSESKVDFDPFHPKGGDQMTLPEPTCCWENVSPPSICGNPACMSLQYEPGEKFYCYKHGDFLLRRFPKIKFRWFSIGSHLVNQVDTTAIANAIVKRLAKGGWPE